MEHFEKLGAYKREVAGIRRRINLAELHLNHGDFDGAQAELAQVEISLHGLRTLMLLVDLVKDK